MTEQLKVTIEHIANLLSYDELEFNNIIPELRNDEKLKEQKLKMVPAFARTNVPLFIENVKSIIFGRQIEVNEKELKYIAQLKQNIPNFVDKGEFEVLTSFGHIEDKIDIIGDDYLVNIATVSNPNKTKEELLLKLFISKVMVDTIRKNASQMKIRFVGLLLTLQSSMLWFDLEKWNTEKFTNIIQMHSEECCGDRKVQICGSINKGPEFSNSAIGHHVSKDFIITLQSQINIPIQFFLGNPQGRLNISDNEIEKLKYQINFYKLNSFIHSPYIINLCSEKENYGTHRLQSELQIGKIIGTKGVVVHVGKYTTSTYKQGIENMINSLKIVLPSASVECPLILETPAGQGTELGSSLESFIYLIKEIEKQIPNSLGNVLKLCIDSCHVFSLGYDPTYFLLEIIKEFPNTVILIHFNDSQNCRGARIDRHEIPGYGHIGYERMKTFFETSNQLGIPCVIE